MTKEVTLSFNIHEYGRTAEGNFRKYDVKNVHQVLESAAVRERIKLREATGFLGHGRRQITGKLDLGEVEMVQTPAGVLLLENIPACVTTAISIDDDGTVHHTQEVLSTDPGKAVQALMESKVGGFSWAAGGRDGQRSSLTQMSGFYGMDYVMTPGYSKNRSYQILESVGQVRDEEEQIFEAMRSCGLDEEKARLYAQTFSSPYLLAAELEAREQELDRINQILESKLQEEEQRRAEIEAQLASEQQKIAEAEAQRVEQIQRFARESEIAVSDALLESIRKGDFAAEKAFFEQVAMNQVKLGGLPTASSLRKPPATFSKAGLAPAAPEYGSIEAGYEID